MKDRPPSVWKRIKTYRQQRPRPSPSRNGAAFWNLTRQPFFCTCWNCGGQAFLSPIWPAGFTLDWRKDLPIWRFPGRGAAASAPWPCPAASSTTGPSPCCCRKRWHGVGLFRSRITHCRPETAGCPMVRPRGRPTFSADSTSVQKESHHGSSHRLVDAETRS